MIKQFFQKSFRKRGFTLLAAAVAMWGLTAHALDPCPVDPDLLPRTLKFGFQDSFTSTFAPGEFCKNITVVQNATESFTGTDFWDKDCNPNNIHIQDTEAGTYTAGNKIVKYTIHWLASGEEGESSCEGDLCKHCSNTFQAGMIRKTTIPGPPVKVINDSGLLEGEECFYFDPEGNPAPPYFTFEPTRTAGVDGDFYPKHVEATCNYLESQ